MAQEACVKNSDVEVSIDFMPVYSSTRKMEVRGSEVKGQSWLYRKCESLIQNNNNKKGWGHSAVCRVLSSHTQSPHAVTPALRRWRYEDQNFKAILSYTNRFKVSLVFMRSCLKKR